MNLKNFVKISYLSVSLVFGAFIGRFSKKDTFSALEVMALHNRIQQRIELLQEKIDAHYGPGYFQDYMMTPKTDEKQTNNARKL